MNRFTIADIRSYDPCYDPARYLPEDWQGTAIDILGVTACPPQDRLWVVLRPGWIDERTMRLWAVWCARRALALIDNPDPRSVAACDIAERYANKQATPEELAAAWAAARDAAWAAAWAAARDAAWAAARDAAWAAAWAAARDAAFAAAWAAAKDAARDAAWDVQIKQLLNMIERGEMS